jgi:hypothetical protein
MTSKQRTLPAPKLTPLTLAATLALALALPSFALARLAAQQGTPDAAMRDPNQVIHNIDAAVRLRTSQVAAYTVQELYSIYRNGEATPSAQVTVKTVYTRGSGKEYTPIAQSGSSIMRNVVINHILANEKEMAKAANRESVALTSANYVMHPQPGIIQYNGHTCVIVDLKARRKIAFLFNGRGWFDTTDFTLVHIEGAPAASPSFFAGQTSGVRDYTRINGFSMAQHAEMHSHSFLFGTTVMKIDYTNYQIQLDNGPHGAE